jgi:hypothetical protein
LKDEEALANMDNLASQKNKGVTSVKNHTDVLIFLWMNVVHPGYIVTQAPQSSLDATRETAFADFS